MKGMVAEDEQQRPCCHFPSNKNDCTRAFVRLECTFRVLTTTVLFFLRAPVGPPPYPDRIFIFFCCNTEYEEKGSDQQSSLNDNDEQFWFHNQIAINADKWSGLIRR